jgi:hypothetical protein
MATSGDFFMATDIGSSIPIIGRFWCRMVFKSAYAEPDRGTRRVGGVQLSHRCEQSTTNAPLLVAATDPRCSQRVSGRSSILAD